MDSNTIPPALFGQMVQAVFYLVGAVCAVVVAVATVWATFFKKKTVQPDADYITRGEMLREAARLEASIKENNSRLEGLIKKTDDYAHQFAHGINNKFHTVNLRIVYMMGLLTQLCAKQNIPVPPQPDISSPDEA